MRALLLVLDGAGCGAAPDASAFGDEGANTLGNVFRLHPEASFPALFSLGLWKLLTADVFDARSQGTVGRWGRMRPSSPGKDSVTGHWELAGVPLDRPFVSIDKVIKPFAEAVEADAKVKFIGLCKENGSESFEQFGPRHLRTGECILTYNGESVVEVSAHEEVIPAAKLHEICRVARRHGNALRIARIVARPFTGKPGAFHRAAAKREYGIVPPRTVLNAITETGLPVHGIGKISEIFGGSGITRSSPALSNMEALAEIERTWETGADGLIFANLADFDAAAGHRRDPAAWIRLLSEFDGWLDSFLWGIESDDLVIITGDHGNDPTRPGSGHTREEVPLLVLHGSEAGPLGTRRTFADVAATLSQYFGLRQCWPVGESFLEAPGTPVMKKRKAW